MMTDSTTENEMELDVSEDVVEVEDGAEEAEVLDGAVEDESAEEAAPVAKGPRLSLKERLAAKRASRGDLQI